MRTHENPKPRVHRSLSNKFPYGFRELRSLYPRLLVRAFVLATAIHVSTLATGALVVSLRHEAQDRHGQLLPRPQFPSDTLYVVPPPPLVPQEEPGGAPSVPENVVGAMPIPTPDELVEFHATIPTALQWSSLLPSADATTREDGAYHYVAFEKPDEDKDAVGPDTFVAVEEMPVLVSMPKPVYPPIAREAAVEGVVKLEILIGRDGRVRDARILVSVPLLDRAAREAALQAVFKPAIQAHKPVEVWVQIPIRFRLE
jgi:TonB family protein